MSKQFIKSIKFLVFVTIVFSIVSCKNSSADEKSGLTIIKKNEKNQFRLYHDGEEFFIKGAGGHSNLSKAKEMGANSIRIWSLNNAQQVLDSALANDLKVMAGLWVAHERHGFNYDDSLAVKKQLDDFRLEVNKFKDHPALLMWAVGNEVDLAYKNTKVWDAVNDIAEMIKEEDGKHPIATVTAGLDAKEVSLIKEKCPAIDVYGINTYGELESIPEKIREYGWEGPYLIGEWGPTGHWQTDSTAWEVPIEETSKEKAHVYKTRYANSILRDSSNCIGSYVFYWGQKQETTPTWYGIFTEAGAITEVGDVLYEIWQGETTSLPAPKLDSVKLNGLSARDNIYLTKGSHVAEVFYSSKDEVNQIYWEILPESNDKKIGGDPENKPKKINGLIENNSQKKITFESPPTDGPYRLFVYITNQQNKVALANIPFYVSNSEILGFKYD
jgi:hypothetical protein